MIVTLDYLRQAFDKYNRQLFDEKLPTPSLKLSRAKTRLGQMVCKRKTSWGRTKYYDFSIAVSTAYDLSQEELDDVIIHEMIHYTIAYTGLRDSSAHGKIFRGMMNAINRKYGHHITITAKRHRLASTQKTKTPSTYLVLAIETKDRGYFLSSVNPAYASLVAIRLAQAQGIASYRWYKTNDDFFSQMPRVRSLRGRCVTKEKFEEITGQMTLLK